MGDRLLMLAEAAELLGLSKDTLRDYARRGVIASVKFPGLRAPVRFEPAEIQAFITRCRRPGAAPDAAGADDEPVDRIAPLLRGQIRRFR